MRQLIIVAAIAAASLVVPAVAGAHVTVVPGTVAPGAFEVFTLRVPTEGTSSTAKVELRIPQGLTFYSYEPVPGWKISTLKTRTGRVYALVVRGRLGVGQFQRFAFVGAAPDHPTTLSWRAIQTYRNGKVVRWVGAPGSEHPASTTSVEGTPAAHH